MPPDTPDDLVVDNSWQLGGPVKALVSANTAARWPPSATARQLNGRTIAIGAVMMLVVSTCGVASRSPDPSAVCSDQARKYGPSFTVAGAFSTTVARLEDFLPGSSPVIAQWQLPADTPAVLCYLDGPIPKAPSGGRPMDREVVVVAGEHTELVMGGYQDQLPVRAP